MPLSAWLIGSDSAVPATTLGVTAPGLENRVVPAGPYYLFDNGSTFDLLQAVEDALNGHTGLTDVSVFLKEDRTVRITSSVAFGLTWSANLTIRDYLGFTGTLSSNTVHDAPLVSKLMWSAGKCETPSARLGAIGVEVFDVSVGQSGPGTVRAASFNSYAVNTFSWRYVPNARVWTNSELGGEHHEFWKSVLRKFLRWKLWRNVNESLSTTAASFAAGSLGPYIMRATDRGGGLSYPYDRELPNIESLNSIVVDAVQTLEYT